MAIQLVVIEVVGLDDVIVDGVFVVVFVVVLQVVVLVVLVVVDFDVDVSFVLGFPVFMADDDADARTSN